MSKNKYLAVIPARQGSERLANKNIMDLNGKPLIAWTIKAALSSKYLNKVIVSTDAELIAEISKKYGAETPFIRPEYLATNKASSIGVVEHALAYYKNKGVEYENVVLLQPTSPLRSGKDIDRAIELQIEKQANSVTSVCEMDHSPLWSNTLPNDNSMENFIKPEIQGKRSQDLETYYRLNGAIFINKVKTLITEQSFISKTRCFAYKMDKKRSVDIDDEVDFKLAAFYLNEKDGEF